MATATPVLLPRISIGVRAWNEESVIRRTLTSIFDQSIFGELRERGERCEIVCIPNGCTDQTANVAAAVFSEQRRWHPFADTFATRVVEMEVAGRNHTWNSYVHAIAEPQAEFLFVMDSDILFDNPDTLLNMYRALLENSEASVSTDRQIKDVARKPRKSLLDRLSLATTNMTRTIEGQMTGQLYCIRAAVARRIWLPKDLGAPDDGFIKALVCTDFFTRPMDPSRIVTAPNASHVYEAYISPAEVLNNQKRQMIGQTTVHVLLDYVKALPAAERENLALHLRRKESAEPAWTRQLMDQHLKKNRYFWQLFPNLLTFRIQRWWKLRAAQKLTHLPAAVVSLGVTLVASFMASRHLQQGQMHFWPKATRTNLQRFDLARS